MRERNLLLWGLPVAAAVAGLAMFGAVSAADSPELAQNAPAAVPAEGSSSADAGDTDATPPAPTPTVAPEVGAKAFGEVYTVLMHPRCMNCHPTGDKPLQTDDSLPHAQNISRKSEEAGLKCATCHGEQNSEAVGVAGGPPGAPNWHLPPADMPMIFQGRTPTELCEQLKRPADNGNKDLAGLLEHVSHDPLVLWGWEPGGDRTKPPLAHAEFVKQFKLWVDSGGVCP